MNVTTDFLETYYEISVFINDELNRYADSVVIAEYHKYGHGSVYELALNWTTEFQNMYNDMAWDGDYRDTLDGFLKNKNKVS